MTPSPQFDKRAVRRSFDRAASSYDAAAVLQQEVCRRMDERLELIKLAPAQILDAGSGTGNALPMLRARYPRARIMALDIAPAMLREARARVRTPWWKSFAQTPGQFACGDIEHLPLAARRVDLVWSNLALQWVNDPAQAFAEFHRVLAPGGLLMFSTFGPDTLKELREAFSSVDRYTHVSRFVDLHDIGDILVERGFADPVMDMEPFTLTYSDVRALMRDLKAIGAHNATRDRAQGLTGRARLAAVSAAYEPLRSALQGGKLPATFEVVYGHAWKPLPRMTASGKRVIDIKPVTRP